MKVLEVWDSTPQEKWHIYQHLKECGAYIPQPLFDELQKEIETLYLDPADRMFNPREG